MVYFPPGDYLTGEISLRNNVTLYLEAGAPSGAARTAGITPGIRSSTQRMSITLRPRSGIIDGNDTSYWAGTEPFAQRRLGLPINGVLWNNFYSGSAVKERYRIGIPCIAIAAIPVGIGGKVAA